MNLYLFSFNALKDHFYENVKHFLHFLSFQMDFKIILFLYSQRKYFFFSLLLLVKLLLYFCFVFGISSLLFFLITLPKVIALPTIAIAIVVDLSRS